MKKTGIAALALVLLLSACGGGDADKGRTAVVQGGGNAAPEGTAAEAGPDSASEDFGITMREILDANRTEVLTASRGSFLMETAYEPEIDTTGQLSVIYADGATVYLETDSSHELYTDQGSYLYMDGYFGAVLSAEPVTPDDFSSIMLDEDTTILEEITGVDDNGDTLTVHTILSPEAIENYFGEDMESTAYLKGDSTESAYTLDAEDLAVLSCATFLYHADGTVQNVGTMSVTYGAELPENGVILREHQNAEELRTVTIVLEPDTEEETVLSATAQRGDTVFPFLPEGYYILYKDPACTEEYDENVDFDGDADQILYSRAMDLGEMLENAVNDQAEAEEASVEETP